MKYQSLDIIQSKHQHIITKALLNNEGIIIPGLGIITRTKFGVGNRFKKGMERFRLQICIDISLRAKLEKRYKVYGVSDVYQSRKRE